MNLTIELKKEVLIEQIEFIANMAVEGTDKEKAIALVLINDLMQKLKNMI